MLEPVRAAGVGAEELGEPDRLARRRRAAPGSAAAIVLQIAGVIEAAAHPEQAFALGIAHQQLGRPTRVPARRRSRRGRPCAIASSGTRTIGLKMPLPTSSVSVTAECTRRLPHQHAERGERHDHVHDEHDQPAVVLEREPVEHPEHRDHRQHDRDEARCAAATGAGARSRAWSSLTLPPLPDRWRPDGRWWCCDACAEWCRGSASCLGGGWGIRTPEGFHPTRFPSVRHRPLGESS